MVVGVYFIAAVSIPDTPAAIEKGEERERKGNTHINTGSTGKREFTFNVNFRQNLLRFYQLLLLSYMDCFPGNRPATPTSQLH